MKRLLLIFSLVILISFELNCNIVDFAHNENNGVSLNVKFKIKGFNSSVTITLKTDFSFSNVSFSRGCLGGYFVKIVTGTYNISDSKITFKPEKIMIAQNVLETLPDNLKFKDTLDYYDSDSTKIQKGYWLVRIEKLKFLVSESPYGTNDECFSTSSNFISLANLYNSHKEQSTQENLLASKDTIINFSYLDVDKNIPKNWREYFLRNSILAKIESVKMIKSELLGLLSNCKLDKGADSGIKVGMRFYEKSLSDDYLEINEVFDKYSKGLYFSTKKIKKGIVVSTEK